MIHILEAESLNQRVKNESHPESSGESRSLKALALKTLRRAEVNQTVNQSVNNRDSRPHGIAPGLIHGDSRQNKTLMGTYPHLAPCPLHGGSWVYRGQSCDGCWKRPGCPAWNVTNFTPETDLPAGIAKLRKPIK